jgi:hypothetical protein
MSNDPKNDLIYAILTMDSYNRGYGTGITKLENVTDVSKIGNYTIGVHSDDTKIAEANPAFAAGFYAIAYKSGSDTVIAYRGTDAKLLGNDKIGGSDPANGYGIALGLTPNSTVNFATEQADLAAAFYRAVTHKEDGEPAGDNFVVTGHSLGGGLAGYVGSVSGTQAITFDHMPFGISALNRAEELGVTAQIGKVRGYFTQGEFLQAARAGDLQGALGGLLIGVPGLGPFITAYGVNLGVQTALIENGIEKMALFTTQSRLAAVLYTVVTHSTNGKVARIARIKPVAVNDNITVQGVAV